MTVLLVLLAVGFAFSMGAHYTGACMGMPHALGAVSARTALWIMAPLAFVGAALVSHGVERTVGHGLLVGRGLSVAGLVVVVGVAFALTTAFTQLRIPTSTIQILVFAVVGAGLAAGIDVHWATIATLAAIWIGAPFVAAALGYGLTRGLDRTGIGVGPAPVEEGRAAIPQSPAHGAALAGWLAGALVAVGALASLTMGSNDVANATGSLVGTHTFGVLVAGVVGGIGLAAGVLTWGRPLLQRVAFDIVTVDRPMATAAQLVQAVVVLTAVGFGFFTSMNQALVGAMTGTAAARGRQTVNRATLVGIVRGWVVGPGAAVALAFGIARLVAVGAGSHVLVAR